MSEKRLDLSDEIDREAEAEGALEERPEVAAGEGPPEEEAQTPIGEAEEASPEAEVSLAEDEEPEPLVVEEEPEVPPAGEVQIEEAGGPVETAPEVEAEAAEEVVAETVEEASSEEAVSETTSVAEVSAEEVAAEEVAAEEVAAEEVTEEEVEPTPTGPVVSSGPGKEWYVVHTYSGYEAKVKASLEERVNALRLQDRISQILVPSEQVVEIKGGKKRISARKFFPGYILVEMELSDDTWYLIKNTPKVTGFLGGGRHPTPLPTAEVEYIIEQMRGEAEKPKPRVLFERGENVRIVDGPFTNFTGVIEEVDEVRGKLRVMVSIFGRATPVEMEFLQVEKV